MPGPTFLRFGIPGSFDFRNHPDRFRVYISGQVRRTTAEIKHEMKRRAAIEPVIGDLKVDHRMGRNDPKGSNRPDPRRPTRSSPTRLASSASG